MSNIEFISMMPGLQEIQQCKPKPSKQFVPQWFKDTPSMLGLNDMPYGPGSAQVGSISFPSASTVKICPAFPDFFSQGYVLPMWCDTELAFNDETHEFFWKTSNDSFSWSIHTNNQFLKWADASLHGDKAKFVFKAECPWRIITPKGWSVLQLPMFYHYNKNFSVLPGIIDTDIHHEINQQVLYHGGNEKITINRGDPFVHYIPFERKSKLGLEIRELTDIDRKLFQKNEMNIASKFVPNGLYRLLQRERDKKK